MMINKFMNIMTVENQCRWKITMVITYTGKVGEPTESVGGKSDGPMQKDKI